MKYCKKSFFLVALLFTSLPSFPADFDSFGAVLDPFVVESNPPGLFERASIKAVRKLIYQPPVFEDQAVNVESVQVDIVFKLQ